MSIFKKYRIVQLDNSYYIQKSDWALGWLWLHGSSISGNRFFLTVDNAKSFKTVEEAEEYIKSLKVKVIKYY